MPGELSKSDYKPFLSIKVGKLRVKADKTTPNATYREYTLQSGAVGSTYEIVYDTWTDRLNKLEVVDGKFGTVLQVRMEEATLSVPYGSKEMTHIISKIASMDFSSPTLKFAPYQFQEDSGKEIRGVNVFQNDVKLPDYYQQYDKETKTWTRKEGFPVAKTGVVTKAGWKLYYANVADFLASELEVINAQLEKASPKRNEAPLTPIKPISDEDIPTIEYPDYPQEKEVNLADVPF
jgi:hypothetical protein